MSHSPDLRFHIYHHSLVRFACLSAKDCGTPRTVTLRSLRSRRSHTRRTAFGFWVLLLCTELIRRLSAYQHLRQLRCLPIRGGVHVPEFVTTWRISINQMEVAGFLPGTRHLLAIFADRLPNNTVTFINLYDLIISSLNEPNEQLLPNIHSLFDWTIHIENNIQRHRILYPNPRCPQSSNPPPSSSAQPTSPPAAGCSRHYTTVHPTTSNRHNSDLHKLRP